MEKKRNNQSIYTTENYIIQCKGKRVDIVFVSTGFELTFHALELQHQSLSLICRALNHLATSASLRNGELKKKNLCPYEFATDNLKCIKIA
jgi:hypothetical protein